MNTSASLARRALCAVATLLLCACPHPGGPEGPGHTRMLVEQLACRDLIMQGDLDSADTRCKLCLEYSKSDPECLTLRGVIAFHRGQHDDARAFYKRALRARPDFAEARSNLGLVYLARQPPDYGEAITLFRSAILIDPGYTDGRANLAQAYLRRGNEAFAAADVEVEQRGVNRADARGLARAFVAAEADYALAEEQLKRLQALKPADWGAPFQLSFIEFQRSRYAGTEGARREHLHRALERGERCLHEVPRDHPDFHRCAGHLAAVLGVLEQHDRALGLWATCLAARPGEPECQRGFQHSAAQVALQHAGLRAVLEQVNAAPGDADGLFSLCAAAFEQGITALALASCEQAVALVPLHCGAWDRLAAHYLAVDRDRAEAACRHALSCDPDGRLAGARACRAWVQAG